MRTSFYDQKSEKNSSGTWLAEGRPQGTLLYVYSFRALNKTVHRPYVPSKDLKPINDSIVVDGTCSQNGNISFRGIKLDSRREIFCIGPMSGGNSSIAEFLAIIQALAYCKYHDLRIPIYSDSYTAIEWVIKKEVKIKKEKNGITEILTDTLERAIDSLNSDYYSNRIFKWQTRIWGENPADFSQRMFDQKQRSTPKYTTNILSQNEANWNEKFGVS